MTRFTFGKTAAVRPSRIRILVLLGGMLIMSASLRAQTPPPIDGVTGTVAPGATLAQEQAVHAVIAKTVDGVQHLFHYTKALFVHGKKGGDAEQPDAPREGKTAAAHDASQARRDPQQK
jgi:hypothetical protein